MTTTTKYINNAAKQMAKTIRRWNAENGLTVERTVNAINYWVDGFENPQMAATCIKLELSNLDQEAYQMVWKPCYMDANGEYTYDSTKWV